MADTSRDWPVVSRHLVVAAVRIECRKSRVPYAMKSKSAVRKQFVWTADTSGDWRVITCRLFVAAVLIECPKSRVPYAMKSNGGHEWRSY